MKRNLLSVICITVLALTACSQPDSVIDLDSDSSIERALVGVWETSDGAYRLTFGSDFSAIWKLDWYTYEGSYRVSDRELVFSDDSPSMDPVFRVNLLTETSLSITGIGRVAEKYGTIQLTRQ